MMDAIHIVHPGYWVYSMPHSGFLASIDGGWGAKRQAGGDTLTMTNLMTRRSRTSRSTRQALHRPSKELPCVVHPLRRMQSVVTSAPKTAMGGQYSRTDVFSRFSTPSSTRMPALLLVLLPRASPQVLLVPFWAFEVARIFPTLPTAGPGADAWMNYIKHSFKGKEYRSHPHDDADFSVGSHVAFTTTPRGLEPGTHLSRPRSGC